MITVLHWGVGINIFSITQRREGEADLWTAPRLRFLGLFL